jgi:hypothetical protein
MSALQHLMDGTKQFLGKFTSLPVGSEELTPAQIVAVFEELLASGKNVVTATDAKTTAVKADDDLRVKYAEFMISFKRIVVGMFAKSPDKLGVFGLKAPKKATVKVETKAVAIKKVEATRKARHTMGSKEKKQVKGVVTEPASGSTAGTGSTAGNAAGATTKA